MWEAIALFSLLGLIGLLPIFLLMGARRSEKVDDDES